MSARKERYSCDDEGKGCAETLFFDYYRQYPLNMTRIFNLYGPRMQPHDGPVDLYRASLAEQTAYGVWGWHTTFCYVDDLVDGLARLMQASDEVTDFEIRIAEASRGAEILGANFGS